MGKRYTIKDIKERLDQAGERMGLSCSHVPVEISTRMKRTYGSFLFRLEKGTIVPVAFRFSLKLVSGDYPDEVVDHTILHEYAHFYTNLSYGENRGHDAAFHKTCRMLGISPHTYFTGDHAEEKKRGYRIFCSRCQGEVARRRRSDAARTLAKKYLSACCSAPLKVKTDEF